MQTLRSITYADNSAEGARAMALIKFGGTGPSDIRGSIGGTTFSRNKGGAYIRQKVTPVNPVSDWTANSRQSWKDAAQAWGQSLTDAQRADWIAFANIHPFVNIFGDSIILNGNAYFQAANKRLAQLGFPMISDAPTSWDSPPPGVIAPVCSVDGAGNISIAINPTNPTDGAVQTAVLYMTKAIPPGRQPQKNDYRMINAIDGTLRDETYNFGPDYKDRFALPMPYLPQGGDKVAYLYAYLDTAQGVMSVKSGLTTIATGIPGPAIALEGWEQVDAGGGNVTLRIYVAENTDWVPGNTVYFNATVNPPAFANANYAISTGVGPNIYDLESAPGTAVPFTASAGTAQREA